MMNGNDESTASMQLQLSSGSVVDGPSASTITSSSSSGGATTSANADDSASASQPNGETQLSQQIQQLNIRQNIIQSNPSSLPELRAYCQSESISLDSLRSIFVKIFGYPLDCQTYDYGILLVDICKNEHVTCEIVQCVIEHVPGAASVVTSRGVTPLHFVCLNKSATHDIVRCVIEGYPGALLKRDEWGNTPLVWLCCNRQLNETVAMEILTLFVKTCKAPASAHRTNEGLLPIHSACKHHSSDFCCMLIQTYPDSIRHEGEGKQVLYFVLFSPESEVKDSVALALAVLKMLLEKDPDMIRDVRWDGMSLLHYAASNDLPQAVEICRLLAQAFPGLVHELDDESGLQPLHIACYRGNLPVMKCILDVHPGAIRGETSNGHSPIHFAVQALTRTPEAAVEVVKILLSVDPSVASQEGIGANDYPLIYACSATNASNLSSGLEVIKLLYNAYPEAIVNAEASLRRLIDINETPDDVKYFLVDQLRYAAEASNLQLVRTQDENGMLPLHRALLEVAPLGAVKLLVQADPATLQIPGSDGSLPIHIAAREYECPDVIKYLLDLNIDSLLVADYWGDTPLHCACRAANYDMIELLLTQTYPTAPVASRNVDGDLPIQLLLDNDDQESAGYVSCIFLLLRANPGMWMNDANIVLALSGLSISDN